MRPPAFRFAFLIVPCLLFASVVQSLPVNDGNGPIQALNSDELTGALYGDMGYFEEPAKRERTNRRDITYCIDWIHNTWRPCRGRKSG